MLPIRETGWNIPQHLESGPHLTLPDAASCFPSTPTIFFPSDLFPFFDGTPDAAAPPARPTLSLPNAAQHASHARSRRKGRQSKICTASGPRDRRMRLSIGVAQRFFHLQDMLGFDKASKTVQWLLTMSTAAIKELASVSSSSKICSSPGDQRSPKSESSTLTGSNNKCTPGTVSARKAKKASVNPTKKAASELHSVKARELRAKARERARERTTQKQKMMTSLHSLGGAKGESSLEDVKALLELANDKGEGNSSFASNYQCLNPVNNSSISGIVDEQYYFWDMDGFSGSYSSSMAAFTNSILQLDGGLHQLISESVILR